MRDFEMRWVVGSNKVVKRLSKVRIYKVLLSLERFGLLVILVRLVLMVKLDCRVLKRSEEWENIDSKY